MPHSGGHASHATSSRKRQARRRGTACKGHAAIHNRLGACENLPCATIEQVESSKPHEEVECLTDPSITTKDAVHDASDANVADEDCSCLYEAGTDAIVDLQLSVALDHIDAPTLDDSLPLLCLRSLHRKSVQFDFAATIIHEVPPYAEIYGAHPRTFVFDMHSQMIPAARGGYVSVASAMDPFKDTDDDDCKPNEEDGGWESWLIEQDSDEDGCVDSAGDLDHKEALGFTHNTCIPDLDDENGWESWLESTLGCTENQFFDDSIQCHEE